MKRQYDKMNGYYKHIGADGRITMSTPPTTKELDDMAKQAEASLTPKQKLMRARRKKKEAAIIGAIPEN